MVAKVVLWGTWLVAGIATLGAAGDLDKPLRVIRDVAAEGRGNKEALAALRELGIARAQALPEIMAALDGANPLAVNYLRGAVEAIAQRELEAGGRLPAPELEKFILDTKHDSRARRLAFELLAGVDKSAPDRLIPGMLHDPSVEFRRDAVARLIEQSASLTAGGKPADSKTVLAQALSGARDDDQVQAIRKQLEGLGEKVDLPTHFGFLTRWQLVAPFDNSNLKGLAAVYPPEKVLNLKSSYVGKEGEKINWIEHTTDSEYGIVNLAKALGPFKGSVAYAVAEFTATEDLPVELRLGTPNSWKVWLNDKLIFAREEYHRGMNLDQYRMRATLKPGKNVILIKICQNEQTEDWAQRWEFQLRVCDATGTAILSADRNATLRPASGGD